MSKLVISEKPSVAQSIAKVLGATSRKEGYIEGGNYIVTWCVGRKIRKVEIRRPADCAAEVGVCAGKGQSKAV